MSERMSRMLLLLALLPSFAQAAYPDRAIRMIVPFAPGGASDFVGRIIAPRLAGALGQQVVVENRAGASGNIGMAAVAGAAPDGYTILLGNIGTIAINPAVFRSLALDPLRDLVAVTQVVDVPSILIANPAVPAGTVAELIALAKARPGELNFASTGSGALSRLEMERLRGAAGIDVVHVPYKGGAGPAITGMLRGETQVMFVTLPSAIAFIQAGKLKGIGISTAERVAALPQVPTMAEAGFVDMVNGAWQGIFVPAGTPRAVVGTLHAALQATLNAPDTRRALAAGGVTVVTSATPEAFAAFVGAEHARWGKVARDAGATVD
jgi:tripartite-type tricarboxylate transporter receptor subunit TctC